mmetsp:Transcript_8248/g.12622  ORF Transcript_8248/g.12622 Transcript_8248/m.12622 type:complete len:127 (-) Transcript_8248:2052-2432(-)
MDTLRFSCSIPTRFNLADLFDVSDEKNEAYVLKSVVCFLGAHYMTYIKQKMTMPDGIIPCWKLYDDSKPVTTFYRWEEIIEQILESGTLPTILIYERLDKSNKNDDYYDRLGSDALERLDNQAQRL